jgi:anti-sigma factor RsiW
MTQTWDCAEVRMSLGVYVLGAIDPAERALVDAHLATCKDCRDELAGLAGIPALLARVNPDEVSRISADDAVGPLTAEQPPEELLGTVRDLAEARRRRNRWRYLSAAAAVVLIAAGLFGGLKAATSTTSVIGTSAGPGSWEMVSGASPATGASATVAYASELWGNAVQVVVHDIPVGTTCQLWAVGPHGHRTYVAAWTTATDEGRVWYPGSVPSSAGPISKFEITAGKRLLVTVTPT